MRYLIIILLLTQFTFAQKSQPDIFSAEFGTYIIINALPKNSTYQKPARVKQQKALLNPNSTAKTSNYILSRQVNIFDRNNEMISRMSIWSRPKIINSNYSQERFEDYLIAFSIKLND